MVSFAGRAAVSATVAAGAWVAGSAPADSTMDLIQELQGSQLIVRDLNGVCAIGEIDAVMAAMSALDAMPIGDMDGDGFITAMDTIARLEEIVDTSLADLDRNHAIEAEDVEAAIVALATCDLAKDVDHDSVTDAEDLAIVVYRQGACVGAECASIAQHLHTLIGLVRQYDLGVFMGSCGEVEHFIGISSSYPSDHTAGWSGWYPPNHMFTITNHWPRLPSAHNFILTADSGKHILNFSMHSWPANHVYDVSVSWEQHNAETSARNHNASLSEMWHHAPGHSATKSLTWPSGHDNLISRTFPPEHLGALSAKREPTPHAAAVSASWVHDRGASAYQHGQAFSLLWPANHQLPISPTWPGEHHGQTSASWPSNHLSVPSATWPAGFPQWPPNHFAQSSNSWGEPVPGGWPVFPEDHSWWRTALDVAPFFHVPGGGGG